jgi:hypothetical protein
MFGIADFRTIKMDDKPEFDTIFSEYPVFHSDDMFTTMVSWNESVDHRFLAISDRIIVMTKSLEGEVQLRPPYGRLDVDIMRQVLELASSEGGHTPLAYIDRQTKEWMERAFPKLVFFEDRPNFDYVYLASDLADLPGNPYAKIRNRLRKFQKGYEHTTEVISQENLDEVADYLERWCISRDCAHDEMLANERKAMAFSTAHFFELGLFGFAIRIRGVVEAVSIGERMNSETAVIHYEKGSEEFDGIYKAINQAMAISLRSRFRYINRASDLGVSGLRKAKMSYHPHHLAEIFSIKKENIIL